MSKYKEGDKFVIEIGEVFTGDMSVRNHVEERYAIKDFNSLMFDKNGLDKLERLDSDYINENFGELQDEAYEAGKNSVRAEMVSEVLTARYEQGLNDSWELAQKLINRDWTFKDARDCFGIDINLKSGAKVTREIFSIPYQEALAKLEAYESEQAEIKVGDVVRFKGYPSCKVLITAVSRGLNGVYLQTDDLGRMGEVNSGICKEDIEKTGKHIDIQSILSEIGRE